MKQGTRLKSGKYAAVRHLILLLSICAAPLGAQTRLTLDECRRMALEHNKSLAIAQEQSNQATARKKAARAAFLPKLDATAAYLYSNRNISLLAEDKFAPVGSVMPDGSFGFTQDQVNNGWTVIDGQPVPLDAGGRPFDPKLNPEKIDWKSYAYLPKESFTVDMNETVMMMAGLTQPLYLGGKIREYYKMAGLAERVAESQLSAGRSEVLYATEESYWQVVSLGHKVRMAAKYVELMTRMEANLTAMNEEGVASRNDVLKVKVRLNEVSMSLTRAENGLRLSKMALCRMIGLPLDSDIEPDENIAGEPFDAGGDEIAGRGMTIVRGTTAGDDAPWSRRPELRSLELMSEMAGSKVRIARSDYLPKLVLTGGYLLANPNPYNGFTKDFGGNFTVGLALRVPVFHWGEKRRQVDIARSERNIAELKRREAAEMIGLQYNQARLRISEADSRLRSADRHLEQAVENLRYADLGFQEGVVQVSGVLEAQAAWFNAYSETIDARIDVRLCRVYLNKTVGTLTK